MNGRLQTFAIGCGAILLLFVLAAVSLYFWAVTPGPQVPTDFILGANSLALMHVEGLQDDAGLRSMIQSLLTDVQSAQVRRARQADIPWIVRILVARERPVREKDVDKTLRDLPRDLTVTLESVPGEEEPKVAVALNLSRFPRVLRLLFSIASLYGNAEEYEGHRLLRLGQRDEGAVTFVEQTAVWGQTSDTLRQVLMRRAEALEDAEGTRILEAYRSRDQRWNLYGVVENRDGVFAWLLSRASSGKGDRLQAELEEELAPVVSVGFGIDVVDSDSLQAQLEVQCREEAEAATIHTRIGQILADALSELHLAGVRIEQDADVEGRAVVLNLRVSNISAALLRRIEKEG